MGVILGGAVVAVVLAVGAGFVLRSYQEPAYERYTTQSVRVRRPRREPCRAGLERRAAGCARRGG
jgi:hypothetical protein